MSWGLGFTALANNVGLSIDVIILIFAVFGSLIFFAKDFKLGVILLFLSSSGCFMLSYALDTNFIPALIVMFMSLVVMSLTLYFTAKAQERGGIV